MAVDLAAAAMRDEGWVLRSGDAIGGGSGAAVTQVHGDSEGVHPLDDLPSVGAQARVAGLEAAIADDVAVVVGELDDPDAELVENIEARKVPLQHLGVLEAEDQPERVVLLRPGDIGVAADDGNERGVAIDLAGPERDRPGGGVECVGADRDVDGGDPGRAMASRCFCDSGPRGGHETFIDPGLDSASMTIDRL